MANTVARLSLLVLALIGGCDGTKSELAREPAVRDSLGIRTEDSTTSRSHVAELFDRYLAASNAHDLEALASMTHEEIVWRFGPFEFRGKEEALRPNGTDLALNTSLEIKEAVVRGDTVEAVLVERNAATRAYGPDSLVHYARYVFRDGLVWRKEPYKPSSSMPDFQRRGEPFRQWVIETHPEVSESLFGGTESFGPEPGRELSRLLSEWVQAGRPGQHH